MNNRASFLDILDYVALSALCFFAAGYSLFNRSFAQLHLQLPFLPFPVFVGEVLLVFCFLLWIGKEAVRGFPDFRPPLSLYRGGAAVLGIFIFLKVFIGYQEHGALALRNAALFYYAFFSWFAASFYNKKFFNPVINTILLIFLLTFLVIRSMHCYTYFMFSYVFLSLVLISRVRFAEIRWFLVGFLLLFLPYLTLLSSSRANILACFIGLGVFSGLKLIQHMTKVRFLRIVLGGIIFVAVAVLLVGTFSRPEEIASVTRIKSLVAQFKEADQYIREQQSGYVMRDVPVQLYAKDTTVDFMNDDGRILETDTVVMLKKIKQEIVAPVPVKDSGEPVLVAASSAVPDSASSAVPDSPETLAALTAEGEGVHEEKRPFSNEPTNNILWRLLVWRDMLRDVSRTQPVFGMHFGKPFRSSSIEIMGWNRMELESVGWMEPHNSYVHIFYRAGWLGLGMISLLLWAVIYLTLRFSRASDTTGFFLVAILVYWIVVANFLVTLELPFFAIPFWCLLGLTWAYGKDVSWVRR